MRRVPKKSVYKQTGVPEVIRVQITMAERRVLTTWSPTEVRAVIRYEWARGTSVSVIHERLRTVYGKEVMSRQMVGRWCCMFSEGRQSVENEDRSGRPSTSTNDNNVARVQEMVLADRRITVSDVASKLHIGRAQAHRMLHDVLGYRKVSARWVPRNLTPEHKSARMGFSLWSLDAVCARGK